MERRPGQAHALREYLPVWEVTGLMWQTTPMVTDPPMTRMLSFLGMVASVCIFPSVLGSIS